MCSTIVFGENARKYLAENYDHSLDHGLVAVNLRGTEKENGRQPGDKAIRWDVQYGSITFNQFSLELPVSGMNEAGLAVALMWHYGGDFGSDGSYARLSALQWIQYQLDTCQNVGEVLEGLKTIRPRQEGAPLHYTFLDADGNTLLVEFIDGEPQTYVNPEFPFLTNSSYATCLAQTMGDAIGPSASERSSVARFAQLHQRYAEVNHADPRADTGFALLQSVNQTPTSDEPFPWNRPSNSSTITAWSIVFSPSERAICWKTHQNQPIREIRLADFDFAKESDYLLMDINDGPAGNASRCFQPYSIEYNREIVRRTAQAFPMPVPEQEGLVQLVDGLYQHRTMRLSA